MKFASIFFFLVVSTTILFIPSFTYRRNGINHDLKLHDYLYPRMSERRLQDEKKEEGKKDKTEPARHMKK